MNQCHDITMYYKLYLENSSLPTQPSAPPTNMLPSENRVAFSMQ